MNLLYGQIVEIASEEGMRMGKIRVAAAFKKVSLELLREAQIGDRVLVCDGIALSKQEPVSSSWLSDLLLSATPAQHSNPPVLHNSNPPPAAPRGASETPNEPGPRIF
jgi:hydrogenase maturation factor